jgi:hypothetical protein
MPSNKLPTEGGKAQYHSLARLGKRYNVGDVLSEVVILGKLHLENARKFGDPTWSCRDSRQAIQNPPTPTIALNKLNQMSSSFVALSKYPGGRCGSAL